MRITQSRSLDAYDLCYDIHMKFSRFDLKNIFKKWLPLGFSITAVYLFGFLAVEQGMRMTAYDTQAEIAGNVELSLGEGTPYKLFNSDHPVQIGESLTPYVLLYDMKGKPVGGNAVLAGNYPIPPKGVFDYLLAHHEDRFTWEPRPGMREAVVARYHGGNNPAYIIVGRSLAEVEKHIDKLLVLSFVLWLGTIFGSFVLTLILS